MPDSESELKTKVKKVRHPEVTVLWLGFIAIISIIATESLTQRYLPAENSDIALVPPMVIALLSLIVILAVSGRIRREQDLEHDKETRQAELAGMREEFNYLASKTIANASTAIKWGLQALDPIHEKLSPAEKSTLDHIRERNDENLEILRNLNLLSRIEQKTISTHPLSVDLREVVSDVVRIAARITAAKGATLVFVPSQSPVIATTDRVLVGDMVLSLYRYCLARTRGASDALTVRCFTVPLEDGAAHPRIVIADNAPPVAPEERDNIFDRILKDKTTGETIGVNLGPHAAKQIAGMLGVTLAANLTDDQTTFTITF